MQSISGRVWTVATLSGVGAVVPIPGVSVALDLVLLLKEVNGYKSQLGLPEENSDEFKGMPQDRQQKVGKYLVTSTVEIGKLFATYAGRTSVEEGARYIPFLGSVIAGGISFTSTYYFLNKWLSEMEEIALEITKQIVDKKNICKYSSGE